MKSRRSDKARGQVFSKFNHTSEMRAMTLQKKKDVELLGQSLGGKLVSKVSKLFKRTTNK